MTDKHALIITGGPFPKDLEDSHKADLVIAADSGTDHANSFGILVDLTIGDFDSISEEGLATAHQVEQHPEDKDVSDLELALGAAVNASCKSATIVTSSVGRLDHVLGNLLVAASEQWKNLQINLLIDGSNIYVVHDDIVIEGSPQEIVSLFAVGGPVHGIQTTGLKWPLNNETLEVNRGIGLSNEFIGVNASVNINSGVLLIIKPNAHLIS